MIRARHLLPLALCSALPAQEEHLLTDNGLGNERYSEYREATRLETGGRYMPRPATPYHVGDFWRFAGHHDVTTRQVVKRLLVDVASVRSRVASASYP